MTRLIWVAGLVALAGVAIASPAHAAFPGQNAKIAYVAFSGHTDIYTMDPDGTGVVNVTNQSAIQDPTDIGSPDWSPDGTQIVFTSRPLGGINLYIEKINGNGTGRTAVVPPNDPFHNVFPHWSPDERIGHTECIYSTAFGHTDCRVIRRNADGTGFTQLVPPESRGPIWSSDGQKIAYIRRSPTPCPCSYNIYTANSNGTGQTLLIGGARSPDNFDGLFPEDWSPDGARILLSGNLDGDYELYSIKPDGTGLTQLTHNTDSDTFGSWSPDGTKIVFNSDRGGNFGAIYVMNADGTGAARIGSVTGSDPDWQLIPINAYPRPKGATPVHASLVPAYTPCAAPNRQHGPPLAFASCNPPAQTSDELTVGTADSNGKQTRSISAIKLKTIPGSPPNPPDDADVKLEATITDVYNQGALTDYTGEVRAQTSLRITDKLNTPHTGGPGAGTVTDFSFGFTISCAPTPDPNEGGACTLNTTADALFPGAIAEGRRAIWQLGAVEVYDGGTDDDGDTPADNTLFMKQGVFVP